MSFLLLLSVHGNSYADNSDPCVEPDNFHQELCVFVKEGYDTTKTYDVEVDFRFGDHRGDADKVLEHFASLGLEAKLAKFERAPGGVSAKGRVVPDLKFLKAVGAALEIGGGAGSSISWKSAKKSYFVSKLLREKSEHYGALLRREERELYAALSDLADSSRCRRDRHCRAVPIGKHCGQPSSFAVIGRLTKGKNDSWREISERILEIDEVQFWIPQEICISYPRLPPKPLFCSSGVCEAGAEWPRGRWLNPFDTD